MKACDSHLHIYEPRFAPAPGLAVPDGMTLDDYLAARAAYGTQRAVLVQPKVYGTDNACLVAMLRRLGGDGCGIAVVEPTISDAEIERLNAAGVRGLRFSLWNPSNAVADPGDIVAMAERIAPLGWHLQLHMHADQIATMGDTLQNLPCPVVIDHMGRLPPGTDPTTHRAFALIAGLSGDGRAWVKLSGPYLNRRAGPTGDGDARVIARAWIEAIPDRLVWGSDWPHVTEQPRPPSPGAIARTLTDWCDNDDALIRRIAQLAPTQLYDFEN